MDLLQLIFIFHSHPPIDRSLSQPLLLVVSVFSGEAAPFSPSSGEAALFFPLLRPSSAVISLLRRSSFIFPPPPAKQCRSLPPTAKQRCFSPSSGQAAPFSPSSGQAAPPSSSPGQPWLEISTAIGFTMADGREGRRMGNAGMDGLLLGFSHCRHGSSGRSDDAEGESIGREQREVWEQSIGGSRFLERHAWEVAGCRESLPEVLPEIGCGLEGEEELGCFGSKRAECDLDFQ